MYDETDSDNFNYDNLIKGKDFEIKNYIKSGTYLSSSTNTGKYFEKMLNNAKEQGDADIDPDGRYFNVKIDSTNENVGINDEIVNEAISKKVNTFTSSVLENIYSILKNSILLNKTTDGTNI